MFKANMNPKPKYMPMKPLYPEENLLAAVTVFNALEAFYMRKVKS